MGHLSHNTPKTSYLWIARHGDNFAASAAPKHLSTPSTCDIPSHVAARNASPVQFSKLSPTIYLPTYLPILMGPQCLSWIANNIPFDRPLGRFTGLLESGRGRSRDASMPKPDLSSAKDGLWQPKHQKIARRAHRTNLAVAMQQSLLIRNRRAHRQAL